MLTDSTRNLCRVEGLYDLVSSLIRSLSGWDFSSASETDDRFYLSLFSQNTGVDMAQLGCMRSRMKYIGVSYRKTAATVSCGMRVSKRGFEGEGVGVAARYCRDMPIAFYISNLHIM